MIEIAEENVFVKKVKFQSTGSGQKYLYIPAVFEENGLDVRAGDEVDLYLDKKNGILFFCYSHNECETTESMADITTGKMGESLVKSWMKRKQQMTKKTNWRNR